MLLGDATADAAKSKRVLTVDLFIDGGRYWGKAQGSILMISVEEEEEEEKRME